MTSSFTNPGDTFHYLTYFTLKHWHHLLLLCSLSLVSMTAVFLALLSFGWFFFFFAFFGAISVVYGRFWATGWIGATATHGNTRSLTHCERPGIEPACSWLLVRLVTAESQQSFLFASFTELWAYAISTTYQLSNLSDSSSLPSWKVDDNCVYFIRWLYNINYRFVV